MQAVANVVSSVVARKLRDEEREQLLNLVLHELRSPLTIVVGFATQLTRGVPQVPASTPGGWKQPSPCHPAEGKIVVEGDAAAPA
jgi:signal transduction histidine kinase